MHLNLAGIRAGPWRTGTSLSSGLDLDFGQKGFRARASLNDRHGVLLVASGDSPLPARGQEAQNLPLSVNAMMPDRALSSLPSRPCSTPTPT